MNDQEKWDKFLIHNLNTVHLFNKGLISEGDIFHCYKDNRIPAVINSKGQLEWVYESKVYSSSRPTAFSRMILNHSHSGWLELKDKKGNLLQSYKKKYDLLYGS